MEYVFKSTKQVKKFLADCKISFASRYDEITFFGILRENKISNIKCHVGEQFGSQIYTFNTSNRLRLVTYCDDGLTYLNNGRVMLPDKNNVLNLCSEPPVDYVFNNFNRKCFKFIQMDDNVHIPNFQFNQNFLMMVQNHIANYLTSLGFAVQMRNGMTIADIIIPIEKDRDKVLQFLRLFNWAKVLKSFANIIGRVNLRFAVYGNNDETQEIIIGGENKLPLDIIVTTEGTDSIVIQLNGHQKSFVHLINELHDEQNGDYDVYNGWDFMPKLKPFYTKSYLCQNPIYSFNIYGKKQIFKIHDKYLPLMNLQIIRINGFRINDVEYWFNVPQFVDRIFGKYIAYINAYQISKLLNKSLSEFSNI